MPDVPRLTVSRRGRVVTVLFNNPPRHFFDVQMSIELDDLTRRLERDRSVGAVIFTGQGSTYLTHFNVHDLLDGARRAPFAVPYPLARLVAASGRIAGRSRAVDRILRRTPMGDVLLMARIYASMQRLNRMDKVVITTINGLGLGMGCVFALGCDIRLMADDTQIGLPESGLAVLAGAGGTQRLVRMVGGGRALELLLEGRSISADQALELGLVHHVVAPQELDSCANAVAERMARRSPVITREIKRMVYDAGARPFGAALRMEMASAIATFSTADAEHSMDAYVGLLGVHDELTDDAITGSFGALL